MKKNTSKKNLKIVGATTAALFSLVTVFTATIAWFSLNHNVGASGMAIKVAKESGRLNRIDVHTLKAVTTKDGVPYYSFNREAITIFGGDGGTIANFSLGEYDPLNTDHPLLIIFVLRGEFTSVGADDMYIKGSTQTVGFLGATDSNGAPVYELGPGSPLCKTIEGVDYYPLSSAVNFKCAHYSESDYQSILSASASDAIDIATSSITLKESFVNFATTGTGITFKQNPTIYSSPGGNTDIKYVAMVVNYDSNAVSAIYSTYLGNSMLEDEDNYGGELHFACDWSLEVF